MSNFNFSDIFATSNEPKSTSSLPPVKIGSGNTNQSSSTQPKVNVQQMTSWNLNASKTGKKDSKVFFEAVKVAFSNAGLSEEERYALMKYFKRLPLADETTIRLQNTTNIDAAKKANGDDIVNSRPIQNTNRNLDTFISAVKKLRAQLQNNLQALNWGTLVRVDYFQNLGEPAAKEFIKLVPVNREMLMGKLIYNIIPFEFSYKLMTMRWKLFVWTLAAMKDLGVNNVTIESGTVIQNGKKVISSFIQFPVMEGLQHVEIGSKPGNTFIQDLTQKYNANDIGMYLAGANCPDFRVLLQCPDVRQRKNDTSYMLKMNGIIAKSMGSVITMANMQGLLQGDQAITMDPKGPFVQTYFKAKAFCSATLRGINATNFGVSGGADTRSQYNNVTLGQGLPDAEDWAVV